MLQFNVTIYIMLQCLKCFNLHKLVLNSINSKIFYKLLQNEIFLATFSVKLKFLKCATIRIQLV